MAIPRAAAIPFGGPQPSPLANAPYLIAAAAPYEHPACRALIHALKFSGIRSAADPLADLLATQMTASRSALSGHIVVPLPLSRERRRMRGFNQAELIARQFADRLALRFAPDILLRTRHAKPQSEITDPAERRQNIAGAFMVRGVAVQKTAAWAPSTFAARPQLPPAAGKNFIVIDDVTTTGATFLEAACALHDAGARQVICLAAARAL